MRMDISPVTMEDLPQLASLQRELIDEEADVQKMRELLPAILRDGNYCLLGARKNGHLVGSLAGIVCYDLFGRCIPFMVVENVIVTKELRRQGIGRALMKEIESVAKERGCRYIVLVSSMKREGATGFYRGLGYDTDPYRAFKRYLEPGR